jgi:tetratricopeptide (TPR) repeat protein
VAKFLEKAQQYSQAGDFQKAIETLRKAPLDDAGAPYVHSRLGTEYLKLGRYDLARPQLEAAAKLAPREASHHSNLSYLYQALGKRDMAEAAARTALEIEGSNVKAHFLLGLVLVEKPGFLREALENLRLARNQVPTARFVLAQVYLRLGQNDAALRELDSFLEVADERQRTYASQWMQQHRTR